MIYDCFIFYNELEVLEIRLNELDKYVDKFVLVESRKTFTMKSKPLHYELNKHLFEKFNHKIIHKVIDFNSGGAWGNEFNQRNSIKEALSGCAPEDIILLSDVDEIPNLRNFDFKLIEDGETVGFNMQYYYYFLNCKMSLQQYIIKGMTYGKLGDRDMQTMRGLEPTHYHSDLGWHFSYMGDAEKIKLKLNSFAHQDMNLPQYNNTEKLTERIRQGKDLFDRSYGFELVDASIETHPEYLVNNKDKFKHLLK
jgi:hypothetical protein